MILLRLIATKKQAGGGYDLDAQAFFTAAGITDATQKSAVNQLVLDLKSYSLWTKMSAIYPFIGGTASSHSYNLKNTAQYQITWHGTVTHNSSGIQSNGSTGYGDTGLPPSGVGSQNDVHVSIYSQTNVDQVAFDIFSQGASSGLGTTCRFATGIYMMANQGAYSSVAIPNSLGHYIATRTGVNSVKGYKNGSTVITDTISSATPSTFNLYICCRNEVGTASYFTTRIYGFASIGLGLNDTDAANLYTAVQAFQTTLGRQV